MTEKELWEMSESLLFEIRRHNEALLAILKPILRTETGAPIKPTPVDEIVKAYNRKPPPYPEGTILKSQYGRCKYVLQVYQKDKDLPETTRRRHHLEPGDVYIQRIKSDGQAGYMIRHWDRRMLDSLAPIHFPS